MTEQPVPGFAGLLRQLRAETGLTQEELAEAAGLSPRSVSDLERGIHRTARQDTARLLADALGLADRVRALFVAAARGHGPTAVVLAARHGEAPGAFQAAVTRTLPRDIAAFTGRQAELAKLMETVASTAADGGLVGIHAIGGMAGIGKTTFAVHVAHRLAASFPGGQFFLPLHAHTPGQRPVEPADALASLLLTAGIPAPEIPPGLEARAARWRDHVADRKILLVLDDAASHEQVRPLLPGTAGILVLITSRRRLTALEDATAVSLDTLPPDEAATLLARLADRPGLSAGDAVVGEITRLCGYLPLAIGMLARQLHHHPAWTAAGLAGDLAAARDRLELMQAENLSVAAAFDLSYRDLTGGQQRLFRRLGLHPGPDIDAYAAAALDETSLDQARHHLAGLYDQHLITEPVRGRYRLHDLLREHAHALAGADSADSRDATRRLLDYYLHTAGAASRHVADWATSSGGRPPPDEPLSWTPEIATPRQAAAWLETERPNLHAAASYAAARGFPRHAIAIPAAISGFLRVHGYWDQAAALNQAALAIARLAGDRAGQALALEQLGILEWRTGDYPAAAASLQQALALFRDLGEQLGQASALHQLGAVQQLTGDYPAAAASQRQALALFRHLGHLAGHASALNDLGNVQRLTGDHPAAAASYKQALMLFGGANDRIGQGYALNNLGNVQRLSGDYPAAGASHKQALTLFDGAGDRFGQAWALDHLGIVQRLTGDYPAAAASHTQALKHFRDLGDRRGQAQALNNLGELLRQAQTAQRARDHHSQALAIAHKIGAPLEEAGALEGIGRCHLHDGNPGEGAAYLRQALAIYRRIGASDAGRVDETLRDQELKPHSLTDSEGHQRRSYATPAGSHQPAAPPAPSAGPSATEYLFADLYAKGRGPGRGARRPAAGTEPGGAGHTAAGRDPG